MCVTDAKRYLLRSDETRGVHDKAAVSDDPGDHERSTTGAHQSKKHSSSGDQMIFQSKLTDIVITEPDSVDATRHG